MAATLRQSVETAIGDEHIEIICHRKQMGTLNDPAFVWCKYDSLAALPERPLDGWEELLVFTDMRVYRWLETGFSHGPIVVPRDPEAVSPSSSFSTD